MDLLTLIEEKGESTPKELSEITGISRQYLHRQLNELTQAGRIRKIGSSPKTFYQIVHVAEKAPTVRLFDSMRKTIESHFVQISVAGELLVGVDAFVNWCQRNKQPIQESGLAYEMIIKRHERFRTTYRCIDGMERLRQTMGYGQVHLNQLLFLDYDQLEQFGHTKYAHLIYFAKISQNRKVCQKLIDSVKYRLENLIRELNVDALAFIPPSEKREVQLIRLMTTQLSFNLPVIKLVKVSGEITVPQKSLTHLADRIENARTSIVPVDKRQFRSVLLIDDQVISGASLNETAYKLKQRKIAKAVYGLAVTGQKNGFTPGNNY